MERLSVAVAFLSPLLVLVRGSGIQVSFVKDINPGPRSSDIRVRAFDPEQNPAYFSANDGTTGREPWISDGSEEGTKLLKDLLPGEEGSNGWSVADDSYFSFGDYVYFFSENTGTCWRSNGSPDGTELVINSTSIRDWQLFQDQLWLVVGQDGLRSYLFSTDGTAGDFVQIPFENPVSLLYTSTTDVMMVAQKEGESATIWSTRDGKVFDFFLDPSELAEENCTDIFFVGVAQPFSDENFLFHCRDNDGQRSFWASRYDDPGSTSLVLKGARIGLRASDDEGLLFAESFGTELFRFNGNAVTSILEMERNDTYIRSVVVPPGRAVESERFYFVDGNTPTEFVEIWKFDISSPTDSNQRIFHFPGAEIGAFIPLSDQRAVIVTENSTDAEFWELSPDFTSLERFYHMNLTSFAESSYYPSFTYLDESTILFSGFDEEHGMELWKMSYKPIETQDTVAPSVSPVANDPANSTIPPSGSFPRKGKLLYTSFGFLTLFFSVLLSM